MKKLFFLFVVFCLVKNSYANRDKDYYEDLLKKEVISSLIKGFNQERLPEDKINVGDTILVPVIYFGTTRRSSHRETMYAVNKHLVYYHIFTDEDMESRGNILSFVKSEHISYRSFEPSDFPIYSSDQKESFNYYQEFSDILSYVPSSQVNPSRFNDWIEKKGFFHLLILFFIGLPLIAFIWGLFKKNDPDDKETDFLI